MNYSTPFNLFANCVPVKGLKRSTICDLQKGTYDLIPNALFEILKFQQGKSINELKDIIDKRDHSTLEEYFKFLVEKEYVFFSYNQENFLGLDLSYQYSGYISNAIIDLRTSSLELDHKNTIQELDQLGCSAVQLRVYDSVPSSYVLKIFNQKLINIQNLQLVLPYENEDVDGYIELYQDISFLQYICVHSSPKNETIQLDETSMFPIIYIKDQILDSTHCGNINPSYFATNVSLFTENMNYNSCLNNKIGIDYKGDIKNCPTMNTSFGNIKETNLKEIVVNKNFRALWVLKKDDIEVCKDCEFRYICTDCRAFHGEDKNLFKPKKCSYNPYTCEW